MSDPQKNFVCAECGTVINDIQRQHGKETECPWCREIEYMMENNYKKQLTT